MIVHNKKSYEEIFFIALFLFAEVQNKMHDDENRLTLCLPIENGNSDIVLSQELTHFVHSHSANLTSFFR